MHRRPGHISWLPAQLLGWPVTLIGAWLLVGGRLVMRRVAEHQSSASLTLPGPGTWLETPASITGAALLAVGVALVIIAHFDIKWSRLGAAAHYPMFSLAGWFFGIAALASIWNLSGYVPDTAGGGFALRFIATERVSMPNRATSIALGVLCIVSYILAYGRASRLAPRERKDVPASAATVATPSITHAIGRPNHSGSARPASVSGEPTNGLSKPTLTASRR